VRTADALSISAFALATLVMPPAPAYAAPAASDADASLPLDEIVVTARRRSELLANVPSTVIGLNADQITRQGVQSEADLPSSIPGLVVRSASGQNQLNYAIRGQSVDAFSSSPPGVVAYVNEVPDAPNSATPFYDLQNVQALKGPQGTLFGRNATGGAILFQTRQPDGEFGGFLSAQYGSYDRFVAEGAINIPIATDEVALRLAGTITRGGAFVRNLYDGRRYGDRDTESGRATLRLKPNDRLTNTLIAQYSNFGGTNAPNRLVNAIPCGQPYSATSCLWNPSVPAFQAIVAADPKSFPGGLQNLPAFLNNRKGRVAFADAPLGHSGKAIYVANITEFGLGEGTIVKNIFGFNDAKAYDQYDYDNSPYPMLTNGGTAGARPTAYMRNHQISEELQIQGKLFDRLQYIVGAFYSNQYTDNDSPIQGTFIVPPAISGRFAVRYNHRVKSQSTALFTQGTYAVTDKLNVAAGIRYTWDKITSRQRPGSLFLGLGAPTQQAKVEDPSWTVTVDYHPTPSLMLYATTRGSWRAGSYNPFAPPLSNQATAASGGNYFLPERVRDVEGGLKFNGRVAGAPTQFNLAVYNSWISNVQRTIYLTIAGNIASLTANIPKAQVTGVEADAQVKPIHWLTLGGSLTYANARFTQGRAVLFGQAVAYGPYGDTPKWSGSIFGQVTATLPEDAGGLIYRADLTSQSSFNFSNLGNSLNPGSRIPRYTLVNMRLDWTTMFGSTVSTGLFVRNLTNKIYYTGGLPQVQNFSSNSAAYGAPRQFGAVVKVGF
jgi:iron complex outermembrane recepter protein